MKKHKLATLAFLALFQVVNAETPSLTYKVTLGGEAPQQVFTDTLKSLFDTGFVNVKAYGANGDARKVSDAVATSGTFIVTSATAEFTGRDVGKKVWACENSTGAVTVPFCTIVSVDSATQITVSEEVGSGLALRMVIGSQDDSDAFIAAKTAAIAQNKPIYIPPGGYILTKQVFAFKYTQETRAPDIIGAGSQHTKIYISADFDYSGIGYSTVIFGGDRGHAVGAKWKGFSLDGCDGRFENTNGGIDSVLVPCAGTVHALLEDIRVDSFKHVSYGIQNSGNNRIVGCHVEEAGDYAGIRCYGQCYVAHTYTGNNPGMGLHVTGVGDNGPFIWIGGIMDECTTAPTLLVGSSVDTNFIGAVIMAGTEGLAAVAEANSDVKFTSSVIIPYNGHTATGMRVDLGSKVTLASSRIKGQGTGHFALENNGTVVDALGNTFSGPLTGMPPMVLTDLSNLPTTDPGIPGQFWQDMGTMKVSY